MGLISGLIESSLIESTLIESPFLIAIYWAQARRTRMPISACQLEYVNRAI
ncbi:MAG: hypothetical protein AAGL17_16295 [Cyanobacteria bacterium J06576_12]